jgi:hypothetical protein
VNDVLDYCLKKQNIVIQELIHQHEYFRKFNPGSINTVRVYVYKSVSDNEWKFLFAALRMGKDGSMDNETSGGIFTTINNFGMMNDYAVDKFCTKFKTHPNSGYSFNEVIPDFDQLIANSLFLANQIYLSRLIGLDMCYDKNHIWRAIEVNTTGHTTRFAQYAGQPFFGKYSNEIIEYCINKHWALKSRK